MKADEAENLPVEIRVPRKEEATLCVAEYGMCIHGYSERNCPWPIKQCSFGRSVNWLWGSKGKLFGRSQQPNGSYWWVHESEDDDDANGV